MVTLFWTDKRDEDIFNNGFTFAWVKGDGADIQAFVEFLSYTIGHKVDWSYANGRAHLVVLRDGFRAATKYITENPYCFEKWGSLKRIA